MSVREPVVIYRSVDREGATFALKPRSRETLRSAFQSNVHLRPRIFIAHESRSESDAMYAELARQVVQLLTGLPQERIEFDVGPVEFRDPATEASIPLSAA